MLLLKGGGEGGFLAEGKQSTFKEKFENVHMKFNRVDVIGRVDREEREGVMEIEDKKQ